MMYHKIEIRCILRGKEKMKSQLGNLFKFYISLTF